MKEIVSAAVAPSNSGDVMKTVLADAAAPANADSGAFDAGGLFKSLRNHRG